MWRKRWWVAWHLAICLAAVAFPGSQTIGAEATDAERIAEITRTLKGLRDSFRRERIRVCGADAKGCLGIGEKASPVETLEAIERAEKSGDKLCTGIKISALACHDYERFLKSLEGALQFATGLAKDVEERKAMTPSINVGFSRDDVPEDSQPTKDVTKISSAMRLDADSYPDDFHAEWSSDVRYSEGKLTEELTKINVHVDRYLAPRLEAFGYVDRSSDSFMSIDQRYEVGFGADWEYLESGRRSKQTIAQYCQGDSEDLHRGLVQRGRDAVKGFELMCDGGLLVQRPPKEGESDRKKGKAPTEDFNVDAQKVEVIQGARSPFEDQAPSELKESAEELLAIAYKRRFFYYVGHRYSRWEVSTSAAVSYDSTQYSIKTVDSVTGDATSISGATTLNRWSLRQSIRFRPLDKVELRLMWFWKPAFGARTQEFRDDVRETGTFYVEYTGEGNVAGWKPKVRYQVDYYHHNNPPTTAELLDGQSSTAVPATAVPRHIVSRLTIGFEF